MTSVFLIKLEENKIYVCPETLLEVSETLVEIPETLLEVPEILMAA